MESLQTLRPATADPRLRRFDAAVADSIEKTVGDRWVVCHPPPNPQRPSATRVVPERGLQPRSSAQVET